MRKIISLLVAAWLCVIATLTWAATTTSINIGINVTSSSQATITGLTLSNTTYTSSTRGTVVGDLVLSGANNGATTFALSGPDAARFQLSSPCTGASCSLEASGTEPDGYHDGKFLVFITPTLAGAKGSGVLYPFTVNETVTCNQTVATGFAASNITTAIGAASAGQTVCIQGSGTINSTVTVNKGVRITGVNSVSNPTITVGSSPEVVAFNITAANVQIDHLTASGSYALSDGSNGCGGSGFVTTTGTSGTLFTYNRTSGFLCANVFGTTSSAATNVTAKYNLDTGSGYIGFGCITCTGAAGTNIWNNNWWQGPPGALVTGGGTQVNIYPFVISGSSINPSGVTAQNNFVNYETLWECYDQHDGQDINFSFNYGLACYGIGNAGFIDAFSDGAYHIIRPRANNNFFDLGTATYGTPYSILQVAGGAGTVMDCTGGDLQGCQVMNNTILFTASDTPSCNSMLTGADAGSVTTGTGNQTQRVSGNTCGGARATMAAPSVTQLPAAAFFANQANGVVASIAVTITPAFPNYVGAWPWPGYGWPGTFDICEGASCSSYGQTSTHFAICVDGQHICQAAGGTPGGSYTIRVRGTLLGLSNSPQNTSDITLTGS
jgi:hypothetical protein